MKFNCLFGYVASSFWSFHAFSSDTLVRKNTPKQLTLRGWILPSCPSGPALSGSVTYLCYVDRNGDQQLWLYWESIPQQPTILNLERVQAVRSAFYIQVTNERKDIVHSASFLWSLEILGYHMNSEGGGHGSFSFTIMLTLISVNMLLPSHCWPLSHLGLSLLSCVVRCQETGTGTV